jgi:AraC-like DNA-binding protein
MSQIYTIDGVTGGVCQLAALYQKNPRVVYAQLRQGKAIADILRAPARPRHRYRWQGRTYTLTELAPLAGLTRTALAARLGSGWKLQRAMTQPLKTRDLTGAVFDWLTVDGPVERRRNRQQQSVRWWPCHCRCGELRTVRASALLLHQARSCRRCARQRVGDAARARSQPVRVGQEVLSRAELAARAGCSVGTINRRLAQGESPERALRPPRASRSGPITVAGQSHTYREWAQLLNVSRQRVHQLVATGRLELHVRGAALKRGRKRHVTDDQARAILAAHQASRSIPWTALAHEYRTSIATLRAALARVRANA